MRSRDDTQGTTRIAVGLGLHTYTAAVLADTFPHELWLWSLAPYLVAGLLLGVWRLRFAAIGGIIGWRLDTRRRAER